MKLNFVRRLLGYYGKFKAVEESADSTIYRLKRNVRKVQQGDVGAIASAAKDVEDLTFMYKWLVER